LRSTRRPNVLVTRKYLARGARLWIGARLLVSALLILSGADPLRLTFATAMLIVCGAVVVGLADLYRRHDRVLLENLAVSRTVVFVFLAAPAMLGELLIAAAAASRG
jgi:hypothetical protein